MVVPLAALPTWPEPANLTTPGYPPAGAAQPVTATPPASATQRIPTTLPTVEPGSAGRQPVDDQQRSRGTVYGGLGGPGPGDMTIAVRTGNPVDNTGSLTGHILAQGWTDTPTSTAGTAKMLGVLVAGLAVLVAIGLLVVFTAGDTFSNLFGGLLSG
jgi:hypothetical protein